jgi:hypothetical protein
MTLKKFLKYSAAIWLAFALSAGCAKVCFGDTFMPDFSGTPKATSQGYFAGQGGVFMGLSELGKALFDDDPRGKELDFLPGLALIGGSLLIHQPYFWEGGANRSHVLQEQGYETAGALVPLFTF